MQIVGAEATPAQPAELPQPPDLGEDLWRAAAVMVDAGARVVDDHLAAEADGTIPYFSVYSWTVPGCVDGWFELHGRFGSVPMAELLAPAIRYAREGFPVTEEIARLFVVNQNRIGHYPGFAETFMPQGRVPRKGEVFRNPRLADTLEAIAGGGRDEFYKGDIARRIDAYMTEQGGLLRYEDLRAEPHRELRKLLDFMQVEATDEHVDAAVEYSSYENMKKMEQKKTFWLSGGRMVPKDRANPNTYKVRRAKVGGYRDYFDDEQVAAIDALVNERLLPGLLDKANDVAAISVKQGDKTFRIIQFEIDGKGDPAVKPVPDLKIIHHNIRDMLPQIGPQNNPPQIVTAAFQDHGAFDLTVFRWPVLRI